MFSIFWGRGGRGGLAIGGVVCDVDRPWLYPPLELKHARPFAGGVRAGLQIITPFPVGNPADNSAFVVELASLPELDK